MGWEALFVQQHFYPFVWDVRCLWLSLKTMDGSLYTTSFCLCFLTSFLMYFRVWFSGPWMSLLDCNMYLKRMVRKTLLSTGMSFLLTNKGATCTPNVCTNLRLRLCIIAHTDSSERCAAGRFSNVLFQPFIWVSVAMEITTFVSTCIRYLWIIREMNVSLQYVVAVRETMDKNMLHFYYSEIGSVGPSERYFFILRDYHPSYYWFSACQKISLQQESRVIID